MNKKGFTLIELIMVIIILGIISIIAIPGVLKSLQQSQSDAGENLEKILENNLEMYNIDNESDIWCDFDDFLKDDGDYDQAMIEAAGCEPQKNNAVTVGVPYKELYKVNPDIDLGDCLFNETLDSKGGKFALIITRKAGYDAEYTYQASIVCSKEFKNAKSNGKYTLDEFGGGDHEYYYQTKTSE